MSSTPNKNPPPPPTNQPSLNKTNIPIEYVSSKKTFPEMKLMQDHKITVTTGADTENTAPPNFISDVENTAPAVPAYRDQGIIEEAQMTVLNEAMEVDDEDRYKPEGSVTLKIDRFSDFARTGSPESQQRLSEPVYIRGLPWKILAIPRDCGRTPMERRQSKALGFFLQCNGEMTDATWNCTASATLKILSQKEGIEDNARKISHTFYSKENDWGYSQFVQCDQLLDPANGYILNDTVILTADVAADAPHGVHWDSKKHAGHIGLKNQGATCYMNSILQTLFFTNKLRKAVYLMPTEDDDQDSSVALAMQRVFYELQFATAPVGTKKLTKSFGWDSVDSFLQHDVQELCRVLIDNLENKMKSNAVADTIPSLFKGLMKSYIKCKNVEFESSREEYYYDVQLNIKGKSNIIESFRDYTEPELLDGDNKYDAGEHGLQTAEKGVKFLSFPPVLHLQLMRFQYDPTQDTNVKINDRFEFPDELHLDEFVDEGGVQDDYTYLLHAVLVHSGDFHGGHYVVFINTNLKGVHKWCKFDDDVVSRATHRDAITANYGGDDPEMICRSYTSAYMLVYVKKSAISDVLCNVTSEDIPHHLKVRFENERQRDLQRKKEKDEAGLFCEVSIISDNEMLNHTGFELFDAKEAETLCRKLKVHKSMTIKELYNYVAANLNGNNMAFRLWSFTDSETHKSISAPNNPRPRALLRDDLNENCNFIGTDLLENDHSLYMELGKPDPETGKLTLPPYDYEHDVLFFLKFYDHQRKVTNYKGPIFLKTEHELPDHVLEINRILELPLGTPLNIYLEIKPDQIIPYKQFRGISRDDRYLREDGGILIAELAENSTENNNAQVYFKNLYNRLEVEAYVNADTFGTLINSPTPPIKGHIGLDWNLNKIVNWLGKELDYDPSKILMWKVSPHNEKPTIYLNDGYGTYSARDLLTLTSPNSYDPRAGRCFKLYYTKLPIPVAELEFRRNVQLQAVFEKFQIVDMAVFPEKNGTIESILAETAKNFKFSENGTGKLRLVHAGAGPNCLRVFQVLPKEMSIQELYTRFASHIVNFNLRVEEIPKDQEEIGTGEYLFPVAHFDKEPSRMFGVPFFIKITNEEKMCDIRRRIKEILEVPDKEFEKYKFFIVINTRIVRELDNDDNAVVNLSEISHTHTPSPANGPYLGIDHMNKSRGMRGGHTAEKAIVIHN